MFICNFTSVTGGKEGIHEPVSVIYRYNYELFIIFISLYCEIFIHLYTEFFINYQTYIYIYSYYIKRLLNKTDPPRMEQNG